MSLMSSDDGEEREEEEDSIDKEWNLVVNEAHNRVQISRGLDMIEIKQHLLNKPDLNTTIQFINGYVCQVISNQSSGACYRVLIRTEDDNKIKWELMNYTKLISTFSGWDVWEPTEELYSKGPKKGEPKLKKRNALEYWSKQLDRNMVDYVTFNPEVEGGVQKLELEGREEVKFLNTFRGFPFQDIYSPEKWLPKEGERSIVKLIEHHLFEVICRKNRELYVFVRTWMRMVRQHPGFRTEVILVFIGEEGAGKSIFWSYYAKVFGDNGCYVADPKSIIAKFSGDHLDNIVLIVCDEADFKDKKDSSALKNLVTSEKRHCEKKGVQAKQVRNMLNTIVTTNSNTPIPVSSEGGNRRFCCIKVRDKMVGNQEYFANLADKLGSKEGLLVFDYWLRKKKVEKKRLFPPLTEEMNNMKIDRMSKLQDWWMSKLEEGRNLSPEPSSVKDGDWLMSPVNLTLLHQQFNFTTQDKMSRGQFAIKLKLLLPKEGTRMDSDNLQDCAFPPLQACRDFAHDKLGISSKKRKAVGMDEENERRKKPKKLVQTTLNFVQ